MRGMLVALIGWLAVLSPALAQQPGSGGARVSAGASSTIECDVFRPWRRAMGEAEWGAVMAGAQGQVVVGVQCTFVALSAAQLGELRLFRRGTGEGSEVTIVYRALTGRGEIRNGVPLSGFTIYAPMRFSRAWGGGQHTYELRHAALPGGVIVIEKGDWQEDAAGLGNFGLSGSLLEGDEDGLGVRVDGRWVLDQNLAFAGAGDISLSLNFRGELASDDAVENFSRSFEADLTFSNFVRWGATGGVQFNATPIAIESDQDMDVVIGRSTVGAVVRIPGSQRLFADIGRSFGCEEAPGGQGSNCVNAGLFLAVDAGWRYDLERPVGQEEENDRTLGARLYASFPLSTDWDLTLRAGWRDDGGEEGGRANHEIGLRYFINCPRRAAFTISYVDGEFSPLGGQIEGLRMGVSALFGNVVSPNAATSQGTCPA